ATNLFLVGKVMAYAIYQELTSTVKVFLLDLLHSSQLEHRGSTRKIDVGARGLKPDFRCACRPQAAVSQWRSKWNLPIFVDVDNDRRFLARSQPSRCSLLKTGHYAGCFRRGEGSRRGSGRGHRFICRTRVADLNVEPFGLW